MIHGLHCLSWNRFQPRPIEYVAQTEPYPADASLDPESYPADAYWHQTQVSVCFPYFWLQLFVLPQYDVDRVVAVPAAKASLQQLQFADLVIDTDKHRVLLDSNKVELTAKEFDLLLHFASHPGRVYSRAELLDKVWNYRYEGYEHTVNSHINRLRNKIEADPAKPRYILTVWGVGYKFSDELS